MGCDIHGYIDYEDWKDWEGKVHLSCFGDNLGERDYKMFGLLAGVRRGSAIFGSAIFAPRGIPEVTSSTVKYAFYKYIIDDAGEDSEEYVTRSTADRWVMEGISKYLDEKHVTHPDWHTPSWLTVKEYEQVLREREEDKEYGGVHQEWYAILAAMKVLKNARFVFWFDN